MSELERQRIIFDAMEEYEHGKITIKQVCEKYNIPKGVFIYNNYRIMGKRPKDYYKYNID
jgi:hypothetical protein